MILRNSNPDILSDDEGALQSDIGHGIAVTGNELPRRQLAIKPFEALERFFFRNLNGLLRSC
jgi:hypothetical protein